MSNSKNDIAWEKLFTKYNIIKEVFKNGHTIISSTQINEFREARLMTKFDHKSQLPKLFTENNFSILPTSRGGYVIGCFETFSDFAHLCQISLVILQMKKSYFQPLAAE